jgi:Uma2 family endonuclease
MVSTRGGDHVSVQPLHPFDHVGPWTWDDLPEREELRGWRAEIVDGGLVLMPPPTVLHDIVAMNLAFVLKLACPDDLVVVVPGSIEHGATWRQPDAMAFRRGAPTHRPIPGPDVVLAVEVQSRGSVSNDRIVKPHEYASVGIPHFWRVELEPEPLLQAFSLVDGTYVEVATVRGAESHTFSEPLAVTLSPAVLLR